MKKVVLLFLILTGISCSTDEQTDKEAILHVMKTQEQAWSRHDLEGFMQGYWKSDSLKFYGSRGITYGWEKTLENYKKGYPNSSYSGTLSFTIDDMTRIEKDAYFVMGQYHLKREIGDANGIFMIIFKKINGQWLIVADTSC